MSNYYLNENEKKLIEKYQLTEDEDILLYFYNKLGKDVLNIVYSKVNIKFSNIPLERDDLTSLVWKSLKRVMLEYNSCKGNLWQIWISNTYYSSIKEIMKYFKNTELILNQASSWDAYEKTHCVYKSAKNIIYNPSQNFVETLRPIIDYVSEHTKSYAKKDVKKLLYLKSLGYSEREIAKKMNVSRGYIQSMVKIIVKISKNFLSASNW